MLADEWYFGHKAYITCFCDEGFRPKLPSQRSDHASAKKEDVNSGDELMEEIDPTPNYDSSKLML